MQESSVEFSYILHCFLTFYTVFLHFTLLSYTYFTHLLLHFTLYVSFASSSFPISFSLSLFPEGPFKGLIKPTHPFRSVVAQFARPLLPRNPLDFSPSSLTFILLFPRTRKKPFSAPIKLDRLEEGEEEEEKWEGGGGEEDGCSFLWV